MSIFRRKIQPVTASAQPQEDRKINTPVKGLVAAAQAINLRDKDEVAAINKRQKTDQWQQEAYEYYRYIPEVHYSANLVADVLSRVNIYVGVVTDSSLIPSPVESMHKDTIDENLQRDAVNVMRLLETGPGGTTGLLRKIALHMFVVGECYLVQQKETFYQPERWDIKSVHEIVTSNSGDTVHIKTREDQRPTDLEELNLEQKPYIARMWRDDPQYSGHADSSLRSVLDLCEQLLLLSRQERVESRSALNNGIIFLPDEIANLHNSDGNIESVDEDYAQVSEIQPDLEEELLEAIMESVEDETAGSTVAPFIIRGPGEAGEKIRHITMQRMTDKTTIERSNAVLDRILNGLAIPKDIAAGLSATKYSNSAVIEQTLYSAHIEPLALLIVDELTKAFLKPVLKSYGYSDKELRDLVVWYDPSAIIAKPSKAEAATTGYQMKMISRDAWRRANGFADSDAPTQLEIAERMMDEKGLISEAVMERLMARILPEIMNGLRDDQLGAMNPQDAQALEESLGGTHEPAETAEEFDKRNQDEHSNVDSSEATQIYRKDGGLNA